MNIVNLVGRLSRDTNVTFYKSDIAKGIPEDKCRDICLFEIGVNRPSKEMGKDSQPIDWIPVTFFHGSKAKFIRHYVEVTLFKSRGEIEVSKYKKRDGSEKTSLRVIGSEIQRLARSRNTS